MGGFKEIFLLAFLVGFGQSLSPPSLQLATILSDPFVMKATTNDVDTRFGNKGILIDLLAWFLENDKSSPMVDFKVLDQYGQKNTNGMWNGIIGEVASNKGIAFGLADVTLTSDRLDAVQFSVPFLTTGLIGVSSGLNFTINQDTLPMVLKMAQDGRITVGSQKGVATEAFFRDSQIQIYKDLYAQMIKSDSNFVKSPAEALDKIRKAATTSIPHVHFDEKSLIEYVAGKMPCDIDLSKSEVLNTLYYALIFNKDKVDDISRYNKLIADYLASGKMQVSRKKWFKNECDKTPLPQQQQ